MGDVQSNSQHFDSKIQFGYRIYSKMFTHLTFYRTRLKFQQDHCTKNVSKIAV